MTSTTPINANPADLVAEIEVLGQRLGLVRQRIGEVIFGQAEVILDGRRLARTELTAKAVARADLVALLTPHSGYDLEWLAATAALLFDARNAFGPGRRPNLVRL